MPETKQVKMVYDGRGYWLLWRWNSYFVPAPDDLTGGISHVSGPFESIEKAEEHISADWTLVPYNS